MNMRKIYRKVAKEYGVSVEEVKREMQAAITDAYTNPLNNNEITLSEPCSMQGRNPNPRRIDPPFIGTGKTKLLKNPICKLHPELVKKQVLGVFRLKGGHNGKQMVSVYF